MNSKAKKLLITTETHEVFIVREYTNTLRGFCSECEGFVEMVTLDAAVSVSGINGREMIKYLACNGIHTLETASGHLRVCRNSLISLLPQAAPQEPK